MDEIDQFEEMLEEKIDERQVLFIIVHSEHVASFVALLNRNVLL